MNDSKPALDGLEQLLALEEKINETINLLTSLRAEKEELLRENDRLRRQWEQQNEVIQKLEDRLSRFEKERETVRVRLQRLVEQVESLTREKSEA